MYLLYAIDLSSDIQVTHKNVLQKSIAKTKNDWKRLDG